MTRRTCDEVHPGQDVYHPEGHEPESPEERIARLEHSLEVRNKGLERASAVYGQLLSENDRLRALIAQAELGTGSMCICPWCESINEAGDCHLAHTPDCPAFSAPGVVR